MNYSFDIIGVSPILSFFNYQQQVEQSPQRSRTYVGSYKCTLDGFIQSTETTLRKPDWDWDQVVESMVQFWLQHENDIQHWQETLESVHSESLVVGRIANFNAVRTELESLFDD